ncbi:NepR family anti-sigma factor [Lichenihabitans psoromatis]|uniref:NepR family anti-sigma factor n=1 Tax=Lichenihabitans psoromatis TaxID=2528642 RepID=UPI0010383F10
MSKSDGGQDPTVNTKVTSPPDEAAQNPVNVPPEGGDRDGASVPTVDIQSYIGSQLRAVFDDVANQPVPDRFLELMRQLD